MSESVVHQVLVKRMADWVAEELLGGNSASILLDSPSIKLTGRPPTINGHVPDLFADDKTSRLLVIGEAKSARDLETDRSEKQIIAFLEYCSIHKDALFVLAVPWHRTRLARNLLRIWKGRMGSQSVSTEVLDMLPG
ncbi:MAG TPA: hypothetical protein VM163_11660 [bacterium]|nr:hypothetical protein [bacterium]